MARLIIYLSNPVPEWNAVDYCIQEEYEAKINFEALDKLDPAVRAGIDMDLLANITHTDSSLLSKYKTPAPPQDSGGHTPVSVRSPVVPPLSRSASLHRLNHDCIEKKLCQKLQEATKRNSLDRGSLRRVRTLSDVNNTPLGSNRGSMSSITMISTRKDSGVCTNQIQ